MNFDRLVKNILNEARSSQRGTSGKIITPEGERFKRAMGSTTGDKEFKELEFNKSEVSKLFKSFKSLTKQPVINQKEVYETIKLLVNRLIYLAEYKESQDTTIDGLYTIGEISEFLISWMDEGFKKEESDQNKLKNPVAWRKLSNRLEEILVKTKRITSDKFKATSKELGKLPVHRDAVSYYSLSVDSQPNEWYVETKSQGGEPKLLTVKPEEKTGLLSPTSKFYTYLKVRGDRGPLLFIDGKPTYGYGTFDLEKIKKNRIENPKAWEKLPENWRKQLEQWGNLFLANITVDEFLKRVGDSIIENNSKLIKNEYVPKEEGEAQTALQRFVKPEKEEKLRVNLSAEEKKARAAERAAAREAFFKK